MDVVTSSAWLLYLSAFVFHADVTPPAGADECRELPVNVQAELSLRQEIASLLERSPTLRRQCAGIGAAPNVQVSVILTAGQIDMQTRARSIARRYSSGLLTVEVHLPAGHSDFVELLAHELEHVREFIEGIDLRGLAERGQGGVNQRRSDGAFETARAREAGIAAAAETYARRR
jgi:hypothetical protein